MDFAEPESTGEACDLLGADPWGAKAIAGGTAVVLMMRQGLISPAKLVSLAGIDGMHGIEQRDDVVRIGAGVTLVEVARSQSVRTHGPSLASACSVVGNPRIRNVATMGGNLIEADYASDPPATLASLGALCHVEGAEGSRDVHMIDLITGFFETVLEPSELVTYVDVPLPANPRSSVYLKYRSRSSEDRACVGVAVRVDFADGGVVDLDVVVAAVAPTLQRVPAALSRAVGTDLGPDVVEQIADDYAEAIDPMEDARGTPWYRRKMIKVFVRRALEQVAEHDVAS